MMINRRKNRRKQEGKSRWAVVAATLVGARLAALVDDWREPRRHHGGGLPHWLGTRPGHREVSVSGHSSASPRDIERAVRQRVGAGLVMSILPTLQHALDSIPWVDSVSVQRQWPRGLAVKRGRAGSRGALGRHGTSQHRGELFASETRHMPPDSHGFPAPTARRASFAQRYPRRAGRLVEAGLRLTALAARCARRLGARSVERRHGATRPPRGGRAAFDTFMRAALKLIAQRPDDIAYVDMRYTNGFAVGWRGRPRTHKSNEGHSAKMSKRSDRG